MTDLCSKKLFVIVFFICWISGAFSQNETYRFNTSVNTAFTLTGLVNRAVGKFNFVDTYTYPPIQGNVDFGIKKWFSVGLGVSDQVMGLTFKDVEIPTINDSITITQDIGIKLNKFNIGARMLFHYGNKGRIDMYSGIRVGYNRLKITHNAYEVIDSELEELVKEDKDVERVFNYLGLKPSDFIDNSFVRNKFAFEVILFSIRGYFTPNFGASAEIAIGKPHFLSFGVNYRFGFKNKENSSDK